MVPIARLLRQGSPLLMALLPLLVLSVSIGKSVMQCTAPHRTTTPAIVLVASPRVGLSGTGWPMWMNLNFRPQHGAGNGWPYWGRHVQQAPSKPPRRVARVLGHLPPLPSFSDVSPRATSSIQGERPSTARFHAFFPDLMRQLLGAM